MKHLSEAEYDLMQLFWEEDRTLTSVSILEMTTDKSWNGNYLHKMLRKLIKEGLLEVCGTVQYGRQYAREMRAAVTREEYSAKLVTANGIGKDSMAKFALALVKEVDDVDNVMGQDDLIEELELLIAQMRMETEDS